MPNKSFTDPDWKESLTQAGFTDFDSFWNAEGDLVEEGNFRGRDNDLSWSHVSRIKLDDGKVIYLKRQQNHYPNNLILKLRRVATFELEWRNYQRMQSAGIPTMNIVYFASRKHKGNRQCIIVSEELKDMSYIDQLVEHYELNGWPTRVIRYKILGAVLEIIKKTHSAGMMHNALYGRHIYFNIPFIDGKPVIPENVEAYYIDLERTKYPPKGSRKYIYSDIKTMFKYIREWPIRDCLWFLKGYLGINKLTPEAKQIIRDLRPTRKAKRNFTKNQ